jgi:DNA-binding response OmpR family regulator
VTEESAGSVLVVDDQEPNRRLLEAVLTPRGYNVRSVASGAEALEELRLDPPDVVLLDVVMPAMDGYEVCRQIRADDRTAVLPVVMITASGAQEKVRATEAGADDFVTKPFDQAELLARVRSLVRVNRYHLTVVEQARQLAEWNEQLERRVAEQVDEIERSRRLRRFLSPQVAELVLRDGEDGILDGHRREIVVLFCDLRGFTPFAETAEPEEVMAVLTEYHAALGDLVHRYDGTLERFTGDGLMVFFNDPLPCEDPPGRAVAMAVDMRARVRELATRWSA